MHKEMPGDDRVAGFDGFKNLQALNLADSQLIGQLPIWLSKLRNLEIDISFNRITGSIPSWLSTLPKLFRLDLSNNLILSEFPKEFGLFPALISPNAPRDDIYLYLPIFLIKNDALLQYNSLSNLQPKIYISNNNLIGNIPIEICCLKQLHMLDLSHNKLSSNIPDQISELTNLEILNQSRNPLSGDIPIYHHPQLVCISCLILVLQTIISKEQYHQALTS